MLKISHSSLFPHPLPAGHRFPMEKYELIPEQLLYEGTIEEDNLYEPEMISEEIILMTHSETYWHKLKYGTLSAREIRKTGFPYSERLIRRGRHICMGTIQNVRYAQQFGIAMNSAGGTHHAYADHGEGFCLFNDFAVAANYLLSLGEISKVLIVDLDVHQGNGTAALFQNDPRVFTFSMHCESNYPLHKEKSDLDIGLAPFTRDDTYLRILGNTLPALIQQVEPDIVFYLAGVDILETDKLGKLSMTKAGCRARDEFVFKTCKANGLPVIVSLGGGYSPRIKDIVEAHCNTFRLAQELWF